MYMCTVNKLMYTNVHLYSKQTHLYMYTNDALIGIAEIFTRSQV